MAHVRDSVLASAAALVLTAVSAFAATNVSAVAPNGGNRYYGMLDPDTVFVADNVDFTTSADWAVDFITASGTVWDTSYNPANCTPVTRTKAVHAGCTAYAPNGSLLSASGSHSVTDPVYGNWSDNTNM